MDNNNETSRRAQQKAIDGILLGQSQRPRRMPSPALPRRRFKGVQTTDVKPPLSKQEQTPIMSPAPMPDIAPSNAGDPLATNPLTKDILADLEPTKNGKAKKDKQKKPKKSFKERFVFFFHPIKTIKGIKDWSWKKRLIVLAITLLVIAGLTAGFLFLKGYFNVKKVLKGGGSAAALQENVDPDTLNGEGNGRVNILLLGAGGAGHEAPDLTDTILIASIDPVNHKTALLSIPRDLYVKVPSHGSMKINAVYETGKYDYLGRQDESNSNTEAVKAGFKAIDSTVEEVTGIPIHYHMLVNFQAFRQAIDTVGGVTIDVPETLYDPTFTRENGGSAIIARPGTQTMSGTKALMYVRSRHTSSDFARSQRQRAVIIALEQKILTLGTLSSPSKISQLMDAFGKNVITDLSLGNVSRLYKITKDIKPESIESVGLTDEPNVFLTTGMVGNQSVVIPKAGLYNYSAIQNFVRNKLKDGYIAKENARITVLNGTDQAGLADSVATTLKSYGYNVVATGDAPTKTYADTIIVDKTSGKKKFTAHYLLDRLKVKKTTSKLPDTSIQAQNTDFVIILGEDETTNR